MKPTSLPIVSSPPSAWEVPPWIVMRRGKEGPFEIVAFTKEDGSAAFGVMMNKLREENALPQWIWDKFTAMQA